MIIEGSSFINEKMKLNIGDRFRVYINMETDEWGDYDYYASTPNANEDMARLNGQWLIVDGVSEEPMEYTHEHELEYEGYIHIAHNSSWEWWWMHMDAVELNSLTNVPMRTEKFMTLPEVL